MPVPRPEYPRPQFVRTDWLCLNGDWEFSESGDQPPVTGPPWPDVITVPFCRESALSGRAAGSQDGPPAETVWYRRELTVPGGWAGRRVLLHFQAVDSDATVWVDGVEVGRHRGGSTPFCCDLTGRVVPGRAATLVVRAHDPAGGPQARGKQSTRARPAGCWYPPTTGIWQTVWAEPVPKVSLDRPRIVPDLAGRRVEVTVPLRIAHPADRSGWRLGVTLSSAGGRLLGTAEADASSALAPTVLLAVPADEVRPWSPEDPYLYPLRLRLLGPGGEIVDEATSYTGLRSVGIDGGALTLNGGPRFQRLVLDQGYYPDGLLTAPSDAALVRDIELGRAAGFDGARLHQKVFEERYLYHADRLGYLVWGEFPDWGGHGDEDGAALEPPASFLPQWLEVLARDVSHPSLVGWCPMNETTKDHPNQSAVDDVLRGMVLAAKAIDPHRPVIDASGWVHRVPEADCYDAHDYEQDPAALGELLSDLDELAGSGGLAGLGGHLVRWDGRPFLLSEFGGVWWDPGDGGARSWGYGSRPESAADAQRRVVELIEVVLAHPRLAGYCYTQLTDVFQEANGIYRFDRTPKFDIAAIAAAQRAPAAIRRPVR